MSQAHILVVDDDHDICATLETLFVREGYQVEVVHDGRAALTRLVSSPSPFIVLLDIMMPTLDGIGVLEIVRGDRELRAQHSFIVMTALNRQLPAAIEQMIAQYHIPLIRKPFDVYDLVAHVEAIIARQQ